MTPHLGFGPDGVHIEGNLSKFNDTREKGGGIWEENKVRREGRCGGDGGEGE